MAQRPVGATIKTMDSRSGAGWLPSTYQEIGDCTLKIGLPLTILACILVVLLALVPVYLLLRTVWEMVADWRAGPPILVCPKCEGQGTLVMRNFLKATIVIEGKRAPDAWAFYECTRCGARWRHHPFGDNARWETPTDEEWQTYVNDEPR